MLLDRITQECKEKKNKEIKKLVFKPKEMMTSMNNSNISTGMLVSPRLLSSQNLVKKPTRDLSENSVEKEKSEKSIHEMRNRININQLSNDSIKDTAQSPVPVP